MMNKKITNSNLEHSIELEHSEVMFSIWTFPLKAKQLEMVTGFSNVAGTTMTEFSPKEISPQNKIK